MGIEGSDIDYIMYLDKIIEMQKKHYYILF